MELTVLMPCLNESETLEICIKRARKLLCDNNIDGEILISDNGSTDGSQQLAESLGARVVNCPVKGYGAALQFGIENAYGTYILMGDSDDSYHFDEAFEMIQKLRNGYDVCMGTRLKGKIMDNAMPPLHRYLGNPVLTGLGKVFFRIRQSDFHCGMRAFKKDNIIQLGLVTTGMEWASEMIIKANLSKLKISEVPITLYKDGRTRPPHLRSWHDGWRHLRFMLIHSPRWLFVVPGLVLMIIGFLGQLLVAGGPLKIGRINLDVHTMLVMAFLFIIGFQTIFTGLFAKLFGHVSGILPVDKKYLTFIEKWSLEKGLIFSIVLAALGSCGISYSILQWYNVNFSNLNYEVTMRQIIPSLTFIAIGVQLFFDSFMISVLFMKTKNR